jgi:phenol/toluene 2-monooxygenase (NADH) P1/A1
MNIDLQAREITPLRNTYAHVAKYVGNDKPASRYQEATYGAQPSANFHYRPTWDPEHEIFDASRSAIVLADWYVLKDPRQYYYATWTMARARQQEAMESNFQFVESRGMVGKIPDDVREKALQVLLPLRHAAWGGLALDEPAVLEEGRQAWLNDPHWQVLRRCVEDSFVVSDPFELFVAQNLALDGLLYPFIYGSFVDDHIALQGGTAVAMLTAFMPEWHDESARWVDAVVKAAAAESDANRRQISLWVQVWTERAKAALAPVAQLALGDVGQVELGDACERLAERCRKAGVLV